MNDNKIQLFNNDEFGEIRIIEVDGEPWFVGKDVATALGYNNPRDAFKKHIDEEDKGVAKCDTLGGTQETTIINESGLYSLVLSSKLPTAKKFKRWVTSEVLPTIRKHGMYASVDTVEKMLADPDAAIRILNEIKAEREKRKELESKIEQDKPKVEWADRCLESNTTLKIGEYAKLIHKENDIVKIRYYDMILIRKEKHDAVIQMKNMAYAERVSLGEMEKRLPPQFVRCHKSYIINIMYVDSIVGSLIYMEDGTQIVAGRKYLADVRKELLAFAQK